MNVCTRTSICQNSQLLSRRLEWKSDLPILISNLFPVNPTDIISQAELHSWVFLWVLFKWHLKYWININFSLYISGSQDETRYKKIISSCRWFNYFDYCNEVFSTSLNTPISYVILPHRIAQFSFELWFIFSDLACSFYRCMEGLIIPTTPPFPS